MITLLLIVLLTAGGAYIADQSAFFKDRQVRQGILFGILAIVANTFSADVYNMGISVGLIDAPPMIAGLMFGSTAGIIAGLIAALERALTPLWGVGGTTWAVCSAATLFVSLYTAAFRNFVFDYRRPHIVPGVIAVAFGEVMHLAFFFLNKMDDFSLTCEVIYASAEPMIFGASAAMALSCLVCRGHGLKRSGSELDMPFHSFLIFGIAFILLVRFAVGGAEKRIDEELSIAAKNFDSQMSKTIELFMYRCAFHVLNGIEDPRNCSAAYLKRGAREHGLDETNIITPDEKIIASNRDDLVNAPFRRDNVHTGEFFKLLDGRTNVVRQGFRHGVVLKTDYCRYLGIPFPKRDAILEVGYSFKRMEKEMDHIFFPAISDAPVYHTGYFLVLDEDGSIINDVRHHPDLRGKTIRELQIPKEILTSPEKKAFYARLFGNISRCLVDRRIGKKSVIAVLPLQDIYWPTFRLVFICGVALFGLSLFFRWAMVKASRNQRMLDELRKTQEEQKERELALTRSIQMSELKTHPTHSERYTVNALMQPAREVGGDSYDYFERPDGKVVIAIADVSGKGVAAAFFMMKVRTTLRLLGAQGKSLLEFMETTNNILSSNNDAMMFVTCWAGTYDPATQELEYICAGHNPPFLVRGDGTAQMLDCRKALPLGVQSQYRYHTQKLHLEHGDQIFTYTDGVTEAMNADHQLFGTARLQLLLEKCSRQKTDLIKQVHHSVKKFADGVEQSDDITMLAINIK